MIEQKYFSHMDISNLAKDSVTNAKHIRLLKDLIKPHDIQDFIIFRVHKKDKINVISSMSEDATSMLMSKTCIKREILNYNHFAFYKVMIDKFDLSNNKLNLLLQERNIFECKYSILMVIDLEKFNALSAEKLFRYHVMLVSFNSLMFSLMRWETDIAYQTNALKNINNDLSNHRYEHLKERYELSDLELEYLKIFCSGCTAKEMALHLDKSFRYIQNKIATIKEKLNIDSKEQLNSIARIILGS